MIIPENLQILQRSKIWTNYVKVPRSNGHVTKPPINPLTLSGKGWDINLTDFDTAAANIGQTTPNGVEIAGVGLALNKGLVGVDLDDVISDGILVPFAADIVDSLDTYTEISPSGHGLHLLLYCKELNGQTIGKGFDVGESRLEIYCYPVGGRYFTVTGNVYRDKPINQNKTEEILQIIEKYSPSEPKPQKSQVSVADPRKDRWIIDSALEVIDPSELDFNKWAAVMTALKESGYSYLEAEYWSNGSFCGFPNSKNDPKSNARRWEKFHFKGGNANSAGIIINLATAKGWKYSDAFTEEERKLYGQSLYTEEQRRQYGLDKHNARLAEWMKKNSEGFKKWNDQHKKTNGSGDVSQEDFENWMNNRKKD